MESDPLERMPGPVLVVAAHPDDIEVHAGGTVARLVRAERDVTYVLATSGNRGTADPEMTSERLAEAREAEQIAAAAVLGIAADHLIFLRHPDGDLRFVLPELRAEIVRLIRRVRPRTILTLDPFPGNGRLDSCSVYPDHTTLGYLTFEAAFVCAPGPLFYPEQRQDGLAPHKPEAIYCLMSSQPDVFVDISAVWPLKWEAIRRHRTQGRDAPSMEPFFHQIAQALGQRAGYPLAEGFRVLWPT